MAFENNLPYTDYHQLNLDWILAEVKKAVELATGTAADQEQLRAFVEDYLSTVDQNVSDQVDSMVPELAQSYLRQMLAAGEFNDEVAASTEAWLAANISNPSNPPLDTSLTLAGAAADSKAAGDAIRESLQLLGIVADNMNSPLEQLTVRTLNARWISSDNPISTSTRHNITEPFLCDMDVVGWIDPDWFAALPSGTVVNICRGDYEADTGVYSTVGSWTIQQSGQYFFSYYPQGRWAWLDINYPSGARVDDDLLTTCPLWKLNTEYPGVYTPYAGIPGAYPYENAGGTIQRSSDTSRKDSEYGTVLDARHLVQVFSDIYAFDYAITDAAGAVLVDFAGAYHTSLINIPAGANKIYINIKLSSRSSALGEYLYANLQLIRGHIWLRYDQMTVQGPADLNGSRMLANAAAIMRLNEPLGTTITANPGAAVQRLTNRIPGTLYRSSDRHQVGFSRTYSTYLSCFDGVSSDVRASNGEYGNNCSGLMTSVTGSFEFLSTTTIRQHYGPDGLDVMEKIGNLADAQPGDILWLDGLTASTPGSNHVAMLAYKIYSGAELVRIIVLEGVRDGCGFTGHELPFNYGERDLYRIPAGKLDFVARDIVQDPIQASDAGVMAGYSAAIYPNQAPLRTFAPRSFYGRGTVLRKPSSIGYFLVPIPDSIGTFTIQSGGSAWNYQIDPSEAPTGTPDNTLLTPIKYSSALAINLPGIVMGSFTAVGETTPAEKPQGEYEILWNGDSAGLYYIADQVVGLRAYGSGPVEEYIEIDGCIIGRTFRQVLAESGQGRGNQYVFDPIPASEFSDVVDSVGRLHLLYSTGPDVSTQTPIDPNMKAVIVLNSYGWIPYTVDPTDVEPGTD